MIDHDCVIESLWDMQVCTFVDGCYTCLVPHGTLLHDVRYIRVSARQQRRMELAIAKGYQVYSDGSDTLVWENGRLIPLFLVEWQGSQL